MAFTLLGTVLMIVTKVASSEPGRSYAVILETTGGEAVGSMLVAEERDRQTAIFILTPQRVALLHTKLAEVISEARVAGEHELHLLSDRTDAVFGDKVRLSFDGEGAIIVEGEVVGAAFCIGSGA